MNINNDKIDQWQRLLRLLYYCQQNYLLLFSISFNQSLSLDSYCIVIDGHIFQSIRLCWLLVSCHATILNFTIILNIQNVIRHFCKLLIRKKMFQDAVAADSGSASATRCLPLEGTPQLNFLLLIIIPPFSLFFDPKYQPFRSKETLNRQISNDKIVKWTRLWIIEDWIDNYCKVGWMKL